MRTPAFCFGRTILYWDTILLVFAALSCALALWAAYRANGGRRRTLLVLIPLGAALSFALARLLYFYCHSEQFASLAAAMADSSAVSFCLVGAVCGFVLAALALRTLRLAPDAALLLDCAAPALALGLALARLSALFNDACRGKAILRDPRFFRLPFAVAEAGRGEYRFAAFFAGALGFALAFLLLLRRFGRLYPEKREPKGRRGDVFFSFLLLLGAEELLVDSVRNDASFFPFNAFISVAQIFAAAFLLLVLIVYSRRAIRARGRRWSDLVVWFDWALGLAGVGIAEYLVQRHASWYLNCYTLMSAAILLMLLSTVFLRYSAERAETKEDCGP